MPTFTRNFQSVCCTGIALVCMIAPSWAQRSQSAVENAGESATPIAAPRVESAITVLPAPDVTYRNGLLTVKAHDASLAEVLAAIAGKTGAVIDIPPNAAHEKIFVNAGPAPASDVLSRILNGSAFDFVIMGSANTPYGLSRILLIPTEAKPATAADTAPVMASAATPEPAAYGVGFAADPSDEAAAPVPVAANPGQPDNPDALPGDVLDQMQKERIRLRQQQNSQQPEVQQRGAQPYNAPPSQ